MWVADEIQEFRYRERFGLSYEQLINEPAAEVRKAFLIWSLDSERDNVEIGKRKIT